MSGRPAGPDAVGPFPARAKEQNRGGRIIMDGRAVRGGGVMRLVGTWASVAVLAAAGLACAPAWADTQAAATSVPAVWTPKKLRFVFMGFTSRYSCDGLRDKVREILRQFGARDDMQLTESPCSGSPGRPTHFPGVTIKVNVLQPANAQSTTGTVAAHWQQVELPGRGDAVREAGDCELVEQVKQSILPLFTSRNVDYHSSCVPNQLTIGGTSLKAEVLVADQPAGRPAAP
jgi:hypothetical protein